MPMLPVRAAVAVLLLGLVSCGRQPASTPGRAQDFTGPPQWRIATEGLSGGEFGLSLRARSACWLRLHVEVTDGNPLPSTRQKVPAGAQVRINWKTSLSRGAVLNLTPEDKAAGRTEPQTISVSYSVNASVPSRFQLQRMTRPELSTSHAVSVLPPGTYQSLVWGTPQEICTMAIADWRMGKAKLVLRHPRSGLRGQPTEPDAHDFSSVARLVLEVEPYTDDAKD